MFLREGGVIVNDIPKIHCVNPTKDGHCILFKNSDLRIPMYLHGIFSCFDCQLPIEEELFGCDKVFLPPDATDWNPYVCLSHQMNHH